MWSCLIVSKVDMHVYVYMHTGMNMCILEHKVFYYIVHMCHLSEKMLLSIIHLVVWNILVILLHH